jgi:PhzF family phenazine biosynthesis protein
VHTSKALLLALYPGAANLNSRRHPDMATVRAPFSLVTAFTSNPFGGNPAAVIFLDTASHSAEYLGDIAKTLNQPMLSVLSSKPLPSDDDSILVHGIQYFAANGEPIPLCGHGTLAASKVVFSSPEVQAKGIRTLHFETNLGVTVKAVQLQDGFIEIDIPTASPIGVSASESDRLKTFVDKAFGRDVVINEIKAGNNGYEQCMSFAFGCACRFDHPSQMC